MNAKISVFFICVEAIIYLLLYNLHDFSFKVGLYLRAAAIQENTVFPLVEFKK